MDELNFVPTHYFLGFIPCVGTLVPNACNSFVFQDETIELWGLDKLNMFNIELRKITGKSSFIPVEQLEDFLTFIEEYKQ